MKKVTFSKTFIKKLRVIKAKDSQLISKIEKQIKLFQRDPKHPSLRIHKLKGELIEVWSISITRSFRIVYKDADTYYFFDMDEHTYIYR